MEIVKTVAAMRSLARRWRSHASGLVPTMGGLHEGHASLVRRCVAENEWTTVSLFVNPIQFAPGEDFEAYPRNLERDAALCRSLGADALFCPEPAEMYPPGFASAVEAPALAQSLCGRSRPTHFQGVCTVVVKLLNIVEPRRAYFGLKDAQQFFILTRLAADLNIDVETVACPIVRESDGLALSSRNAYLSVEERRAAPVLGRALAAARARLEAGERRTAPTIAAIAEIVAAEKLARLDYAEAVAIPDLRPVETVEGPVLLALAAYLGRTRLIDNLIFDPGADR
jgi:pantoate--beta-alanine ligase